MMVLEIVGGRLAGTGHLVESAQKQRPGIRPQAQFR